jgi:D-alanine transaminase
MSRIVFVNGSFVPYEEASIPIMDRGFLFADGIYEVSAVLDGRLVDNAAHLARLDRSLGEIRIANPYSTAEWIGLEEEMVRRNNLREGLVYMQVTRGVSERDFAFPKDVKSVALLAQVLAKQAAAEAGVAEAWMVEDGFVTEGGSSTAFIITKDNRLVTRPLSHAILPGITRRSVMRLAKEADLAVEERLFSVQEAYDAAEAFFTSATSLVMPVVQIDDRTIGEGKPGPLAQRLRALYLEMAAEPVAA